MSDEVQKPAEVKPGFDPFSDEFSAPLVVEPEAAAESDETPQIVTKPPISGGSDAQFVREIDLGDGAGKQVFKGRTAEELIDNLVKAQTNATLKIREQQVKLRARPELEPANQPQILAPSDPQQLTGDELFQISQELTSDPAKAFDRILQAQTGMNAAQLRQIGLDHAQNAQMALAAQAENEFLANHATDYLPNKANATKIISFIQEENLPYTTKNIEYAFQELNEGGLLESPTLPADANESRIEVQAHTRRKTGSTGLSSHTNSGRPPEPEKETDGITESEVEQIYALPIEQARALMLKKMRASSTGRSLQ